jgi:polyhydroxybutyrate depolymerase
MRALKKAVAVLLWGAFGVAALAGLLFFYFIYSPTPEIPHLSGVVTKQSINVSGLKRTYRTYVPKDLASGAPLIVVMHGSGENGGQIRLQTGYEFDRLADEHRFAVVYPDGYEGYWNACNKVGDYAANRLDINDVQFLTALVDRLARDVGSDRSRVFAAGVSRGGFMAFRLALEAPERFRAVAAVSASVPTLDNFKCRTVARGTSSVLIINGTSDPIIPFAGGEVRLFGFLARGTVLSSRASARYFANLNHLSGAPETHTLAAADGFGDEQLVWRNHSGTEVELDAIDGGGHGMPQPYYRNPRLLGPTAKRPDGPDMIWGFFARQRTR